MLSLDVRVRTPKAECVGRDAALALLKTSRAAMPVAVSVGAATVVSAEEARVVICFASKKDASRQVVLADSIVGASRSTRAPG